MIAELKRGGHESARVSESCDGSGRWDGLCTAGQLRPLIEKSEHRRGMGRLKEGIKESMRKCQ